VDHRSIAEKILGFWGSGDLRWEVFRLHESRSPKIFGSNWDPVPRGRSHRVHRFRDLEEWVSWNENPRHRETRRAYCVGLWSQGHGHVEGAHAWCCLHRLSSHLDLWICSLKVPAGN
jgi:hypothetical protein